MTTAGYPQIVPTARWRPSLSARHVPVVATIAVWLLLVAAASVRYEGFLAWPVFLNLLRDNAFLGICAVGMTFVILSGGIDLSVGAMIGFTSILVASLISDHGWPAGLAISAALTGGLAFGAGMGAIIAFIELPPFLVTLAAMFLVRGLGQVISLETLAIGGPFYSALDDFGYRFFPVTALLFLATLVAGIYVAHQTRFGRAVYAIGGNEHSALLMGVPVKWTKVRIYALSGLCSALAGVAYTLYTSSGNANAGTMLELDAIAAVVIGGTPLTGGVGYVLGTLVGVLILGTIQTIITFEGTLSSWWTKIAIGVLLLTFIVLQKVLQQRVGRRLIMTVSR
jgi:simple sugar transport system permease protein